MSCACEAACPQTPRGGRETVSIASAPSERGSVAIANAPSERGSVAIANAPSERESVPIASAPSARDRSATRPHVLDPDGLSDHIDQLYRAAWALCGSRHDAEDLVQETFVNVLKRPRMLRDNNEIGYLLRALKNTYASRYRRIVNRPVEHRLNEDDAPPQHEQDYNAREIMQAIAAAPAHYRDAVIAVDVLGLSYREAARALRTREATVTSRLHRGRQHVARELISDAS